MKKRIIKVCLTIIFIIFLLYIIYYKSNNKNNNIVYIKAENNDYISSGNGIVYKHSDGYYYIITNYHIVYSSDTITIYNSKLDNGKGILLYYDDYTDIAIIKTNLKGLEVYDSFKCNVDSNNVHIESFINNKIINIKGNVLSKSENVNIDNTYGNSNYNAIKIQANVDYGNSGSPVYISNSIIGILSSMNVDNNIAYVIPICDAIKIANKLEKGGLNRPSIGATIKSTDDNSGVIITNVSDDLKSIGLLDNDVIIEINGNKVNTISDYRNILYTYSIGDKVELTYSRDNIYNKVIVKLK